MNIDEAITALINDYSHNVPDALEIILQATMREVLATVDHDKEASQTFRNMAHEIIDMT